MIEKKERKNRHPFRNNYKKRTKSWVGAVFSSSQQDPDEHLELQLQQVAAPPNKHPIFKITTVLRFPFTACYNQPVTCFNTSRWTRQSGHSFKMISALAQDAKTEHNLQFTWQKQGTNSLCQQERWRDRHSKVASGCLTRLRWVLHTTSTICCTGDAAGVRGPSLVFKICHHTKAK